MPRADTCVSGPDISDVTLDVETLTRQIGYRGIDPKRLHPTRGALLETYALAA